MANLRILIPIVQIIMFGYYKETSCGLSIANLADPSTFHNSKLNISPALRHLAKGVFSKALLKGSPIEKNTTDSSLKNVSLEDLSDCAKKLICELQSKKDLTWDEALIKETIPAKIEYTSPTIQLELAADLGQKKGKEQCAIVYNRCPLGYDEILEIVRQNSIRLQISTNDQFECQVQFVWSKVNCPGCPTASLQKRDY